VIIWAVLFWLSALLLLHTYFLYPLILLLISKNKKPNEVFYSNDEGLPRISILLSVHNEESVLPGKISTTLNTTFPKEKLEWLIGSDCSTDRTNELLNEAAKQFSFIRPVFYAERTGKPAIINELSQKASGEILLLTDANVFFTEETILSLIRHFKNPTIALVAGNIQGHEIKNSGIARQESVYLALENRLKYAEGKYWGAMMGAFGGCYAIRKNYFHLTPPQLVVDDFYITMAAIQQNGQAILEPAAVCFEDVSNKMEEEFRRKTRIAMGDFQNLKYFKKLLFSSKKGVSLAFWSHKVLRWVGPFFLIVILVSNLFLFNKSFIYQLTLFMQLFLVLLMVVDFLLSKLNRQLRGLKYISHFFAMNAALMWGFLKFLTGVQENVWKPTERNQ
jgi:cellulose synthase/poly-beta-1,6-N-acetylglucosamine synthase-like glycosyltransferase